jgi:hypothetical protein
LNAGTPAAAGKLGAKSARVGRYKGKRATLINAKRISLWQTMIKKSLALCETSKLVEAGHRLTFNLQSATFNQRRRKNDY